MSTRWLSNCEPAGATTEKHEHACTANGRSKARLWESGWGYDHYLPGSHRVRATFNTPAVRLHCALARRQRDDAAVPDRAGRPGGSRRGSVGEGGSATDDLGRERPRHPEPGQCFSAPGCKQASFKGKAGSVGPDPANRIRKPLWLPNSVVSGRGEGPEDQGRIR
jgi:hypothetical protein